MGYPNVLYFIDRGDRPEYHRVEYHRYIICTRRDVAYWEAKDSGCRAKIWQRGVVDDGSGWLLLRWNGLDIDYGVMVQGLELPDGSRAGFVHPSTEQPPWSVLNVTVWWSDKTMPPWLERRGVNPPADSFSRGLIRKKIDFPYGPKLTRIVAEDSGIAGVIADWLEERGETAAAGMVRAKFIPAKAEKAGNPVLFAEGP
jgi:hypothetical protein